LNRDFLRFSEGGVATTLSQEGIVTMEALAVYDVLYMGRSGEKVVARGLAREDACDVAKAEARRRGVGRMFLTGSELGRPDDLVVIVDSNHKAA
jgi:hypothetical protein